MAAYDDVYFVTKFLSGLKEEIRAPITLHRPPNLETAITLALLQEAELELAKPKSQYKSDHKDSNRFQSKYSVSSERQKLRKEDSKPTETSPVSNSSDKLSALKAFRRANNLCFTLGRSGLEETINVLHRYPYM